MRQLTISKTALRVLVSQLEAKGDGFNIKQLRTLDKTALRLNEAIVEYNNCLDDKITEAKNVISTDPQNEALVNSVNERLNKELNAVTESEGKVQIEVSLEDEQYSFVKEIMDNSAGFRGNKEARKIILEIDDAIRQAKEINN